MTADAYPIAWTPTARRALTCPPEKAATAAIEVIYGQLAENPQRVGKPLRFELQGLLSARRGDYRITEVVTIIAIEHRADAYRTR